MVDEREAARARRDFAAADTLRERIREAGYDIEDTPEGPRVGVAERAGPEPPLRPADVPSALGEPPQFDLSLHWLVEGWPQDIRRGIESVERHRGGWAIQHVIVDVRQEPGEERWPGGPETIRLEPGTGWGAARNAGLIRSRGRVVAVVDGSVEAIGDVAGPLIEALRDPRVGLTGPFGIVSDDLHEFRDSEGPEVDAVEAYLIAVRRDLLSDGLRFDEGFRFYRTADIELSFQIKARGLRCTVTPIQVTRHEHRAWASTPEEQRRRLSKRNFYRFLDRWRGRTDLLVSRGFGGRTPG